MPVMIIHLVTRKKEQVGIKPLDICHDIVFRDITAGPLVYSVAGEGSHHDGVLVDRIFFDGARVKSLIAMGHPVLYVPGMIPVFYPEMSGPSILNYFGGCNFFPFLILHHLQAD